MAVTADNESESESERLADQTSTQFSLSLTVIAIWNSCCHFQQQSTVTSPARGALVWYLYLFLVTLQCISYISQNLHISIEKAKLFT